METKQIKCMLTMQSSIAQMLFFSHSMNNLPTDDQLVESVVQCVKHMEHEEGFEISEDVTLTMCKLALNIKKTIKNPEGHLLEMISNLF